jgi:hypothetical protein
MNWQHIVDLLHGELASGIVVTSLVRLVLAAVLGGLIGLERGLKHQPAGLRTNIFICFGSALFTGLSDALAVEPLGDHTHFCADYSWYRFHRRGFDFAHSRSDNWAHYGGHVVRCSINGDGHGRRTLSNSNLCYGLSHRRAVRLGPPGAGFQLEDTTDQL